MYKEKLDNGVSVRVADQSRQVAGDRWRIKLVCTVSMPVEEGTIEIRGDDSTALFSMICERIGKEVNKEFVLERNFIDESEKEDVSDELMTRINENIKCYLASERFPALFLGGCYDEAKAACQALNDRPVTEQSADDEGPADFSGCFQD